MFVGRECVYMQSTRCQIAHTVATTVTSSAQLSPAPLGAAGDVTTRRFDREINKRKLSVYSYGLSGAAASSVDAEIIARSEPISFKSYRTETAEVQTGHAT